MVRIRSGLATSVARPRWNSVSTIDSPSCSRSSCAVSSSPVASGTGGVPGLENLHVRALDRSLALEQLLGSDRVVACTPAFTPVALDLVAQPENPVCQSLGAGRTARDVYVDRHELVGRDQRVVVEHAGRGAAGTH